MQKQSHLYEFKANLVYIARYGLENFFFFKNRKEKLASQVMGTEMAQLTSTLVLVLSAYVKSQVQWHIPVTQLLGAGNKGICGSLASQYR